jgi:hypothetical protein
LKETVSRPYKRRGMNLKSATEADLAGVAALTNMAFRGDVGWTLETKYIEGQRTSVEMLQEELAANPEALLMIWRDDEDGSLLGSVWLEPSREETWGCWLCGPNNREGSLAGRW